MIPISKVLIVFAICNSLSVIKAFKLIENTKYSKNSEINPNLATFSSDSISSSSEKYYLFGSRITGDKMKGEAQEKFTFPSATDKEVLLLFPQNSGETKFKVTEIRIYVNQSSPNGTAHIIDGGIEESFIKIKLKAEQTMFFSYLAECYGY